MNDRVETWKKSRARERLVNIYMADVSRPFLENPVDGLEQSSFEEPFADAHSAEVQREGFDKVEDGEDPDCDHVLHPPPLRTITMGELRRLAAFPEEPTPTAAARRR